jgi:hypothetical protein
MPTRISRSAGWFTVITLAFSTLTQAFSAPLPGEKDTTWNRPLPFAAEWALERGIDLPNPFGVGMFAVVMSRDFAVSDVRVTLPGQGPTSISEVASFDVRNHTTLAALKVDAWILPLLNVYVLAGHTWSDSKLNAAITIPRPIRDPVVMNLTQDMEVGGPLLGAGATLVAGYGHWFVMADANYNYSDIEELGGIAAWFISGRTGWSGALNWGSWRAWAGVAYLSADRTLRIEQEVEALGTVIVEVDQGPLNPMTLEAGGSIGISKRWEIMIEVGSNFDDASLGVFALSYRF